MYTECVSCDRDLGHNTEVPGFAVGRRLAFDRETGRLWVICPRCEEWNLALIETRWEAVEACERLADGAEARVTDGQMGLARTEGGLELLRVGGFGRDEIANWRYGRVMSRRRRWSMIAMALTVLAIGAFGLWASLVGRSAAVGAYAVALIGYWGWWSFKRAPHALVAGRTSSGRRFLAPGFRIESTWLSLVDKGGEPQLTLPGFFRESRFSGRDAMEVLARVLAQRSWSELADVDVAHAVKSVDLAESGGEPPPPRTQPRRSRRKRRTKKKERTEQTVVLAAPAPTHAWRRIASWSRSGYVLKGLEMPDQLALEMALREELDRLDMAREATDSREEWKEADEVGRISDDLLLPERIWKWIRERSVRR